MGDKRPLPTYTNFLFSSIAGVGATLVCYPLDLLKTRMQVLGKGGKGAHVTTIGLAKSIIQGEGVRGLYTGISASVVRQATYTGVRMGAYQTFIGMLTENGQGPNLLVKCICGCVSGAMGGIAGLPPDVVLTRMAIDPMVPVDQRRNYSGVFSAMAKISRDEGHSALFRGLEPVVVRAMVVNVSQLVSYSTSKEFFIKSGMLQDNTLCHVTCSVISAFVATTCVLPPDIAKTRMQNMRVIDGKGEYSGMLDVWRKIASTEGVLSLWKGFTPLFLRNGPQFVYLSEQNKVQYSLTTFQRLIQKLLVGYPMAYVDVAKPCIKGIQGFSRNIIRGLKYDVLLILLNWAGGLVMNTRTYIKLK